MNNCNNYNERENLFSTSKNNKMKEAYMRKKIYENKDNDS